MKGFSYSSSQSHTVIRNGKTHTRRNTVRISNGEGIKEVKETGKRATRKRLTRKEIAAIAKNKFIPGLFRDCLTDSGSKKCSL